MKGAISMKPDIVILIFKKATFWGSALLLGFLAMIGGAIILLIEESYIWTAEDKKDFYFSENAQNKGVNYIKFPVGNIETFETLEVFGSEPRVYFMFGENGYGILNTRPFGHNLRKEKYWDDLGKNPARLAPSKIYPGENQNLIVVSYNPHTKKKGKVRVKVPSIQYRKIE